MHIYSGIENPKAQIRLPRRNVSQGKEQLRTWGSLLLATSNNNRVHEHTWRQQLDHLEFWMLRGLPLQRPKMLFWHFFFLYIFHLYTLSRVVSGGVTHLYKVVVQNKLGHRKRKTHLYNVVDQHKLGWEKRLQISQTLGIKCAEFADYSWIIPPSISGPNYPLERWQWLNLNN